MTPQPLERTREGRMLAAGRLVVSVRSRRSGRHVTLRYRCSRKDEAGPRRWPTVPFAEATHIFIDQGAAHHAGERVGTLYVGSGEARFREGASDAAKWTALAVLRYVAGRFDRLAEQADLSSEDVCGRCGRRLTDPESVEYGIGPDCRGIIATESRHAAMTA